MVSEGLLIDTCAAIWILEDAPLDDGAITAMDEAFDDGRPVFVSLVTAWEFGLLASRGRLALGRDALGLFALLAERARLQELGMSTQVLVGSSFLPGTPPRDPFDRIVISTARVHGLTILTRDRLILDYARQGHVSALAC